MQYRIEYITYNNSDFKQSVFCETKEEAESKVDAMKKIKHITAVSIKKNLDTIDEVW